MRPYENVTATARTNETVKIYVECDYHLYEANRGNAQQTADFAAGLFNVVSAIYANENIKVEVAEIKVWTTPDPYPTSSAKVARDAFGLALDGRFKGDIAQLLSNYMVNGTVPNGGSANIDALCNKKEAVSYANITTAYSNYPTYSWTAYAVTHEIGHVLGSPHTHSCLWSGGPIDDCWCPEGDCHLGEQAPISGGTIMSYCHLNPEWTDECSLSNSNPGINLASGFGRLPGDLIRNRISSASCLGGSGGVGSSNNFRVNASVKNESCFGYHDGAIFLDINNGQAPYTFQWSNGVSSQDLENIGKGDYSVTVTDKNGQTSVVSAKVDGTSPILVDAGEDKTIDCNSPIVTLDANNSRSGFQYNYRWTKLGGTLSGKTNERTLSISEAGTYIFTITNTDNACKATDTVLVTKNTAKPQAELKAEELTCDNSVTLINTIPNQAILAYQWTGPQNFVSNVQNPIIGLPGIYHLTLTGENGCINEQSIEVFGNKNTPQITASATVLSCDNGSSQLSVSSSDSELSYEWKGPNSFQSSVPNPVISQPGIYQVKATAPNGCSSKASVEVKAGTTGLNIRAKGGTLDCNNPSIQFQVNTEKSDVDYYWTGPNNFTSEAKTPIVSTPGVYQLQATAANGCTEHLSVLVEENFTAPSISIKGADLNCEAASVVLKGLSNNLITSYLWKYKNEFLSNEKSIETTQAGIYELIATGENGCTTTTFYEVKENIGTPALEIKGRNLGCGNASTRLNAITDSENITFNWAGPNDFQSTEQNPEVSIPGKYTLLISDENGCTNLASIDIYQQEESEIVIEASGQLSCKNQTIFLDASKSLLTENAVLEWTTSNGNILSDIHANRIEVDAEGTYVLTIRDLVTECVTFNNIKIEADAREGLAARIENDKILSCQQSNVVLGINEDSYSSNTTFFWETEDGHIVSNPNKAAITVDAPGFYTLLVTDTLNGCSEVVLSRVIQPETPVVEIATPQAINCHQASITIDGSASILNAHSLIEWSRNGVKIESSNAFYLNVNAAGTYSMTIIDTLTGCQDLKEVEVLEIFAPQVEVLDIQQDICGKEEGAIELGIQAMNENFQIKWSDGRTESRIENLKAGTYTATVTDEIGCSTEFSQNINTMPSMSLGNVEIEPVSCSDTKDGSIQVSLKNGHAPYQLEWSNGDTTFFAKELAEGIHALEVTDAKGCVNTFYFELTAPELLEASVNVEGNNASVSVNGGMPDYRISWSNGAQGTAVGELAPGDYWVNISDANNCNIRKNFSIDALTATNDLKANFNVAVFPNPASDFIKITKKSEENGIHYLSIFSVNGQLVFSKKIEGKMIDETIDVRNWKGGNYFLQMQTKQGRASKKIQVVRK